MKTATETFEWMVEKLGVEGWQKCHHVLPTGLVTCIVNHYRLNTSAF